MPGFCWGFRISARGKYWPVVFLSVTSSGNVGPGTRGFLHKADAEGVGQHRNTGPRRSSPPRSQVRCSHRKEHPRTERARHRAGPGTALRMVYTGETQGCRDAEQTPKVKMHLQKTHFSYFRPSSLITFGHFISQVIPTFKNEMFLVVF